MNYVMQYNMNWVHNTNIEIYTERITFLSKVLILRFYKISQAFKFV